MSAVVTTIVPSDRRRRARELLAVAAGVVERAWGFTQLTHAEGERHPLQKWLSTPARRACAVVVVFAIVALFATKTDLLLAGTPTIIQRGHLPALFAGLVGAAFVIRRAPGGYRRALLLFLSLGAAAYFSVGFALFSVVYFTALYGVLVAPVPRAAKIGFVVVTFAAAVLLYTSVWPSAPAVRGLFVEAFVFNYTFRILYLVHELNASRFQRRPRYVDVLLYLLFAPFFLIVPSVLCIPRFDRFVASIDKPMPDGDLSAIRYALAGGAACAFLCVARRLVDPGAVFLTAFHEHRWATALAAGVLTDPVWRVLHYLGVAYVLTAMMHLLGVAVAPPLDRPLASRSFLDWWRRWNVHFRDFLVDVFFYPVVLRARRPYLAIALGCVAVFLVGSTALHCLVDAFLLKPYRASAALPVVAENVVTCALVLVALCFERRRRGKRTRRTPALRLSDPAVAVAAWARERFVIAGRIAVTLLLVFVAMRASRDVTSHIIRAHVTSEPSNSLVAQGRTP